MPPDNDKHNKEGQNVENFDNDVRCRKCYVLLANVLEKATCVKYHGNHQNEYEILNEFRCTL